MMANNRSYCYTVWSAIGIGSILSSVRLSLSICNAVH